MKIINNALTVFISIVIILVFSAAQCSKNSEDECEKTAWEETKYAAVQPKLKILEQNIPEEHNLKEAVNMTFKGNIKKLHCNGSYSETFEYLSEHIPAAIDETYWEEGFYVGRVYEFSFSNDEDVLEAHCELIAEFSDGKKYYARSPYITTVPYSNILTDIDNLKDYYIILFPSTAAWEPYESK